MKTRGKTVGTFALGMSALTLAASLLITSSSGTTSPPVTVGQQIFNDSFTGTTLDSNWNAWEGAPNGPGQASAVWNNGGNMPAGDSGPNCQNGDGNDLEIDNPSQITVNNGLSITATPNTTDEQIGTNGPCYTYHSGALTYNGTLPITGWYVQATIKVPDMSHGLWPGMWFLDPGAAHELDALQGGFTPCSPTENYCPMGTGYFANGAGQPVDEDINSVGFDATTQYVTYGVEYQPGVAINYYVNGNLYETIPNSDAAPGGIPPEPYNIIINLQVGSPKTSGWHTVANGTPGTMYVSNVQAWTLGSNTPPTTTIPPPPPTTTVPPTSTTTSTVPPTTTTTVPPTTTTTVPPTTTTTTTTRPPSPPTTTTTRPYFYPCSKRECKIVVRR